MPVILTSFLLPSNTALPYLIADTYLKGGMRCLQTIAQRDAIKAGAKSAGMFVWVSDERQMFQLASDLVTWEDAKFGSDLVFEKPFQVTKNESNQSVVTLMDSQLIPETDEAGLVLTSGPDKTLVWTNFGGSAGAGARLTKEYVADNFIAPGENINFTLELGKTCTLLNVTLNAFDIEIQAHKTEDRNDRNPYVFRSTVDFLSDDGVTLDGDILVKHRRYAILSSDDGTTYFCKMRNLGSASAQPKLTVTYLVME